MSNKELQVIEKNEVQQVNQPDQMNPMQLVSVAVSQGADIDKLSKLMDLQERWEANQARRAFNEAMSSFQVRMPVVPKRGNVDYTSSKGRTVYDFGRMEDAAKLADPILSEVGLSYRWTQKQENGLITVTFILTHKLGHSEENSFTGSPDTSGNKDALKAAASTVSYLRRYTMTGGLGIVFSGEDDESTNEALGVGIIGEDQLSKINDIYNVMEKERANRFWKWVNQAVTKREIQGFHQLTNSEATTILKRLEAKA